MSSTLANKPINPLGYGLMGLTWRPEPLSDEQVVKCMETAYNQGQNFWNGGEFYGPQERNSLHILNTYFTKHPEQDDKVVISIKGGAKPGSTQPDGSPENVRRSIDECLKVLDGKKFLNLFECARVDPDVPIEITIGAIADYVKAGKLGGISLSECSAESIKRASKVHKIACVEVEFSLWATEILDNGVAQTCKELNIPIVAYSPLGRGFLTGQVKSIDDIPEGDFRRHLPRFQPGAFEKNLDLVHKVEKIADRKGVKPGQIGIAWVLAKANSDSLPEIMPIPGASSPPRVQENAVTITLTPEEVKELDEIVANTEVHGDRYPAMVQKFNFGDSPALKEVK